MFVQKQFVQKIQMKWQIVWTMIVPGSLIWVYTIFSGLSVQILRLYVKSSEGITHLNDELGKGIGDNFKIIFVQVLITLKMKSLNNSACQPLQIAWKIGKLK